MEVGWRLVGGWVEVGWGWLELRLCTPTKLACEIMVPDSPNPLVASSVTIPIHWAIFCTARGAWRRRLGLVAEGVDGEGEPRARAAGKAWWWESGSRATPDDEGAMLLKIQVTII